MAEWQNLPTPSSAVTKDYDDNACRYRYSRLKKKVYLVDGNANIHIDNGTAYINNITNEPIILDVYNLNLEETDNLDGRYSFTHQLSFSIRGYADYRDFDNSYYVVIQDYDDVFWVLNPQFPCKVTFNYYLDYNSSHTDFVLSTASNHPMLMLNEKLDGIPYNCKSYYLNKFKSLKINEFAYSSKDLNNNIYYANDGFKDIVFNRNSQVLNEYFDGSNISHTITINVNFSDYKSSWHYNLLEFNDNRYSVIIEDSNGNYITCGFEFGLVPNYTVYGSDSDEINRIEVTFSDIHDNGEFLTVTSSITINSLSNTEWVFTNENNGYECVGLNRAKYLLKKEIDALGIPTNRYMCLNGYEDQFSFLDIVGTFDEIVYFTSSLCSADNCRCYTSLPDSIIFNTATCYEYTIECDTDWTIDSNSPNITVTPNRGDANEEYTIQVCNSEAPSGTSDYVLTINYCDTQKIVNVRVEELGNCLIQGNTYYINADGGTLTIPFKCCIKSAVTDGGNIFDVQLNNGSITAIMPKNTNPLPRQFGINIVYCNDVTDFCGIIQEQMYDVWKYEGSVCNNGKMCDLERLYTGTTYDNINTPTSEVRTVNCFSSEECATVLKRWVATQETTCFGGKKYIVEAEEQSIDDGETWTLTGNKRQGSETSDPHGDCAEEVTYEYRWVITTNTQCEGYDKLYLYKQEMRISGSSDAWEDVIPSVFSVDGDGTMPKSTAETQSEDCGYKPYVPVQYAWRVVSNDYICDFCGEIINSEWRTDYYFCDEGDKYAFQTKYVTDDNVYWYASDEHRNVLIESESDECS